MKSTNGSISASTISGELPPPTRQSILFSGVFFSFNVSWSKSDLMQDRPGYFFEITPQQLPDRRHYGTASMRTVQNVTVIFCLLRNGDIAKCDSLNSKTSTSLFVFTDFWQIDSWKALVPCVVMKTPEVINATNAASWSMLSS